MNCIEFDAAAERAIETRSPLDGPALAHAATCSSCQANLIRHRYLDSAIDSWKQVQPPSKLLEAVLSELSLMTSEHVDREADDLTPDHDIDVFEITDQSILRSAPTVQARMRRSRTSILAMTSLVACLFVMALVTLNFDTLSEQPKDRLTQSPPNRRMKFERSNAPYDVSNTLIEVYSDIRSEYREIASETSSAAKEIINAIPHHVVPPFATDAENIELLPDANDVGRILNPIGSRVATALDFLWQTVPSEASSG